jgi:LEA14-like dessication related protein
MPSAKQVVAVAAVVESDLAVRNPNPIGANLGGLTVETDIISAFNSSERRAAGRGPGSGEPVLYIEETSARWGTVNTSTTEIDMRFVVYNPNSYPVPVSELSYRATMNGVEMGTGTTEGHGVIPPKSTRTIDTTTVLDNGKIDEWWVTHLENDQVTDLRIDFAARVELPTGTVELPLRPLTYTETIETDIFGTKGNASSADGTATPGEPTPTEGEQTTATPTPTPEPTPTPTDDGGFLDGDEGTSTPEPTATPTPTPEPTATPTPDDDDGLLDVRPAGSVPRQPVR